MKVAELISYLEDQDPEADVLIAHQPSWPLQETLGAVVGPDDLPRDDEDEWCRDEDETVEEYEARLADMMAAEADASKPPVVYLRADGHPWDQSPYAPKALWDC